MIKLSQICQWTTKVVAILFFLSGLWGCNLLIAKNTDKAYKVGGKTVTVEELMKEDANTFYEIEKQRYETIERIAEEKYFDYFWNNLAKKEGKSLEVVKKEYFEKQGKVSEAELKDAIEKFKAYPQFKELSDDKQREQAKNILESKVQREALNAIIEKAKKDNELVILYEKPKEPVFQITIKPTDNVRFGPKPSDTKPIKCKGDDCPITVVEFSEFQCPFCSRVIPDIEKVLEEYKGKIRWITRDFPLNFHNRARPAAIAAHCSQDQDHYWDMYTTLFKNQRNLGEDDLQKYAKEIGLDMAKFNTCIKSGGKDKLIDENFETGVKAGVNGTPAFFINGRRLSGALPYSQFKQAIDEELKK